MQQSMPEKPGFSPLPVGMFLGPQTSYEVPVYQREYAWSHEQIEALLDDLFGWADSDDPYYLLGQAIVAPSSGSREWALVDGQQRVTSIYLLLTAILRSLEMVGALTSEDYSIRDAAMKLHTILVMSDPVTSSPISRVLTAKGGDAFISLLREGKTLPGSENLTQENIKANFDEIRERVAAAFPDAKSLVRFLNKLLNGVWLIRLEMKAEDQALEIFEKINNRGLALNSADLLKNLLFQEVSSDDFDWLSKQWEDSAQLVFSIKARRAASMEFLMKALLAAETGESVPTKRVFKGWKAILSDDKEKVVDFGSKLTMKSRHLKNLASQNLPNGGDCAELAGTSYFGAVQHFTVLLAGSHLNDKSFRTLAALVEDRTVLSLLARERSQDYERILPKWAERVSKLPIDATPDHVFDACSVALADCHPLLKAAETYFSDLSYSIETQKKRIRYALARVSKRIEDLADNNVERLPLASYLKTSKGNSRGYDIEHVLPQSIVFSSGWDESRGDDFINQIGNLVLLHPSDNRGAGAQMPRDKAKDYAASSLLITKSLCEVEQLGLLNERVQRQIDLLHGHGEWSLDTWNERAVRDRTNTYWKILETDFLQSFRLIAG
jgi:Protein of unknown function DUF262/Protein of unknown function (DUF1524)